MILEGKYILKTKEVKNEKMPYGRIDWRGRTPRWTCSWNLWKFAIIKECLEFWFLHHPETKNTIEYQSLYDEICNIHQKMQTPLMSTTDESDLF